MTGMTRRALKITACLRRMSSLIVDLTGQTLVLLVIFGNENLIIVSIQLSLNELCMLL